MAQGYDQFAGADREAALNLLDTQDYGFLHVWLPEAHRTQVTFLHFAYDAAEDAVLGHLANSNPVLERLAADPRATFMVYGPGAYVPSHWMEGPYAVPTSYYTWAQFDVTVETVSEPEPLVEILQAMLARYQPEGRHPQMRLEDTGWQKMVGAITGVRLKITGERSRYKLGQNKPRDVREAVAARMEERGGEQDLRVAAAVRETLGA